MPVTIYALLTWTTRDRAELIDADGAAFLRQFLPKAARQYRAQVLAMGIVRDHVHLLLFLDALVDVPTLVQRLKGASARIANRDRVMGVVRLRWAKGYGPAVGVATSRPGRDRLPGEPESTASRPGDHGGTDTGPRPPASPAMRESPG
jgi:REP element-mobilizing transposase RayT